VLVWKNVPSQSGTPPDIVLGQADFMSGMANRGQKSIDAGTLNGPSAVYADYGHIYVSDSNSYRVLIWNTVNPMNGQPADVVLGAPDFTSGGRIYGAGGMQVYHGRLYLCDGGNNRVIYWNSIPSQNGILPDGVLGQPDLKSGNPNSPSLSVDNLQDPSGVLVSDVGVYIADTGNGRIVARPPLP
jgi:hypothetical protein